MNKTSNKTRAVKKGFAEHGSIFNTGHLSVVIYVQINRFNIKYKHKPDIFVILFYYVLKLFRNTSGFIVPY